MINENSLGESIADNEEMLKKFWQWFGDSQAVDEKGRPIVFYHGSKMGIKDFDQKRLFASEKYSVALSYAKKKEDVYLIYLKTLQPGIRDCHGKHWSQLIPGKGQRYTDIIVHNVFHEQPFDCIVFKNIIDRGPFFHEGTDFVPSTNWVVKDARSQVALCKTFRKNNDKTIHQGGNSNKNDNKAKLVETPTRKIPSFIGKTEEETIEKLEKFLNPAQWKVFQDYYFNNKSVDEIAELHNIKKDKIKQFIVILRKKIHKHDPDKPLNPNIDYKKRQFKKGSIPWNKGLKGQQGPNKTTFTTDNIKHAEVGKPRDAKDYLVTATADKVPVVDKRSGKTYMHHKRESYPRWLLKQNGIEVPSNCVVWHKDGDYQNNELDNLEVIPRSEAVRRIHYNKGRNNG